ncbi:hypothetical protein CRG98_046635 [Punica granatum]|nr:hypothetical protein CRG98_046635 [Punica granatum]
MAKAVEGCSPDISCPIPMPMPGFPRDLLQNFISGTHFPRKFEEKVEDDDGELELELTLGLSLNGRFGVDPGAKKLVRSSSIPELLQPLSDNGSMGSGVGEPILRTCSLPMESEDECRKRKAMQSLRRMEAKRKRTEKQRNSRAINGQNSRVYFEDRPDEDRKMQEVATRNHQKDQFLKGSADAFAAKEATFGMSNRGSNGKGADFIGENGHNGLVASRGSGSLGVSEFDSLPVQGSNKSAEARSPSTTQCSPDNDTKSASIITAPSGYSSNSSASTLGNGQNELAPSGKGVNGMVRDVLLDMPCVSTKGDGPDGKKIEGFLYRYKKGEEVKIVCVCHGRFLSPAEFVKHAGGGDVSHPLKHIVVNASPFFQ